ESWQGGGRKHGQVQQEQGVHQVSGSLGLPSRRAGAGERPLRRDSPKGSCGCRPFTAQLQNDRAEGRGKSRAVQKGRESREKSSAARVLDKPPHEKKVEKEKTSRGKSG